MRVRCTLVTTGVSKRELDTPALLVDLDVLDRNIERISGRLRAAGVGWRPHTKGIKVPALAHKLLRAGASLIVTTRFPRDSAARYAGEPDFSTWGHRLEIFGLDLRHTPSVEAFCSHLLQSRERLDFIINNACQTVRRPPDYYEHMMARETESWSALPAETRRLLGA